MKRKRKNNRDRWKGIKHIACKLPQNDTVWRIAQLDTKPVVKPDEAMKYAAVLLRARELERSLTRYEKDRAHYLAGVSLTPLKSRRQGA